MEIKITNEVKAELTQLVADGLASGEFELPEGFGGTDEAFIKEEVARFIAADPDLAEMKNAMAAQTLADSGRDKQVSETPLQDMIRYGSALRHGDHKLAESIMTKDHIIGTTTAGGHLAPTEYSNQLIDLVFKDSNVMGFCKKIPMKSNSLVIPTLTAGLSAYTIIESTDAGTSTVTAESTGTYSTVTLTAYKHGIVTYISNELLEDSDPSVESIIRNDITRQLASYVDWEIFHGTGAAGVDGTAGLITGLETLITSNTDSAGGAPSFDDVLGLQVCEDNVNAPLMIFMAPAARRALTGVKANTGQYIYDPTVRDGSIPAIWGMPVVTNNRISKTLGAGAETALFCGAFGNSALIGTKASVNLIVDPFSEADFASTRIVAHFRIAFQVAAENHFSILDGVTV